MVDLAKKYYWKKQGDDAHCCGQIAVSIILHKSLKETIKLFGHNKGTWTRELVKVLKNNNVKCDDRLKRKNRPKLGIAKLKFPDRSRHHYVIVYKDKIFDGINGTKDGTVNWKKKWKITSYLEIYNG